MCRGMRSTTKLVCLFGSVILAAMLSGANPAEAHHTGDHAVTLHVNNIWSQCALVLDPSLTQSEFHDFAHELAPILYFRPLAGAKPLGKFKFEFSYEFWKTSPIQDYAGKWNNTFSHPNADHWLTGDDHTLGFAVPRVRMGVTDTIDAELFYTVSPGSNYGFLGIAMKYGFLDDPDTGWAFAVRPTYSTLTGVDDMKYSSMAVDLLASRDIGLFRPYAGASLLHGTATETTVKVNLNEETVNAIEWMIGSEFNWKYLRMALEADLGVINMYSFKIGVAF